MWRANLRRAVILGLAVLPSNPSSSATSAARDAERSIDLAHVTVERFAAMLGGDPKRSFEFVRDYVAWEPYRGSLRGARGTLIALAGNSLDRALLLEALLSAHGHGVQLMSGRLPPEAASRLASSLFPSAPSRERAEPDDSSWATLVETLHAVAAALPASVGAGDPVRSLDGVAREASEHHWVRCSIGGKWVDLDPALPAAEVGTTLATSARPLDVDSVLPFRVDLRLRTRTGAGENERIATVFEWTGVAAQLAGEAFVVEHVPARGGGGAVGAVAGAFTSALSGEGVQLRPLVTLAGKRSRGAAFAVGPPASPAAAPAGSSIPGLDRFRRPAAQAAVVEQEWLEVDVTRPDGSRHQAVRLLHDATELANPALVRSQVTVVSILSGVPSRAHFLGAAPQAPLAAGDFEVWRLLRALNLLLVTAPAATAPGFALPEGRCLRYFVDTPQIVVSDVRVADGRAIVRGDLRSVSQRVVANFEQTPRGRALARVLRGLIDTRVEADFFRESLGDGGTTAGETAAAVLLDRAASAPKTLQPLAAADLDALPLRDGVRELARRDLEAGFLLLGASRADDDDGAPRAAWWRVDPLTGATIGVLDTGLHQTSTEVAATDDEADAQAQGGNAAYSREMQRGTAQTGRKVAEKAQRLPGNHPVEANDYGAGPNFFEMPRPYRPPGGINAGDPVIRCTYPSRGPHDWWNALF